MGEEKKKKTKLILLERREKIEIKSPILSNFVAYSKPSDRARKNSYHT